MSEYITEWYWDERRNAPNQAQREEIVRCGDCGYYDDYTGCCVRRDNIVPMAVTPDGFCAWGESREPEWVMCKCGEEIELGNREFAVCPSCGRMVRECD